MKPEERIAELQRKIVKVSMLESPGSIMAGLGFYGKFGANGNAFHPLLNDPAVVNALLVVGVAIMILGASKIISLKRECTSLKKLAGLLQG